MYEYFGTQRWLPTRIWGWVYEYFFSNYTGICTIILYSLYFIRVCQLDLNFLRLKKTYLFSPALYISKIILFQSYIYNIHLDYTIMSKSRRINRGTFWRITLNKIIFSIFAYIWDQIFFIDFCLILITILIISFQ
jgi:hypothetical protein